MIGRIGAEPTMWPVRGRADRDRRTASMTEAQWAEYGRFKARGDVLFDGWLAAHIPPVGPKAGGS